MLVDIDNDGIRELFLSYPKKGVRMLYRHFYHSLVQLATGYTGDAVLAEDITQEAFAVLWEKRDELASNPATKYRNFLIRVVKFKSIDFVRHEKVFNRRVERYRTENFLSEVPSIELSLIKAEEHTHLWRLIMTFPKRERECLSMRFENEMSLDEIAAALKISRKSVERSLTSAKKRLIEYRKAKKI